MPISTPRRPAGSRARSRHIEPPDRLSVTFAALSNPTRRAIVARLAAGEASVTELAQPFAMSLPAVSKHLKVLERAGLIERGRHAQWRPCRLAPEPLREIAGWVERYRQLWEASLERLDAYLAELQAAELQTAEAHDTADDRGGGEDRAANGGKRG